MVINTDIRSIAAHRDAKTQDVNLRRAQERLSSGVRLNSAADDAAGMAIATKMQAQSRGLDRAELNIGEGINFLTVADGTASVICDKLNRVRELAVYALNDTQTDEDREIIDTEVQFLFDGTDDAAMNYTYNTIPVAGPQNNDENFWIQVGANAMHGLMIELYEMTSRALFNDPPGPDYPPGTSIDAGRPRVLDIAQATEALEKTDAALDYVNGKRAYYGALMNTLQHLESFNRIGSLNLQDAASRIYDADMAKEVMNQSKSMVMMNASLAMISQAHQDKQRVMSLLGMQ